MHGSTLYLRKQLSKLFLDLHYMLHIDLKYSFSICFFESGKESRPGISQNRQEDVLVHPHIYTYFEFPEKLKKKKSNQKSASYSAAKKVF